MIGQKIPRFYGTWRSTSYSQKQSIGSLPCSGKPILSQLSLVHMSHALLINFSIAFPSTPSSPKQPVLFRISDQNFVCISYFREPCYMVRPSHRPWFNTI